MHTEVWENLSAGDIILYSDPCVIYVWKFGHDPVRVLNGHGEEVDVWHFMEPPATIAEAVAYCEKRVDDLVES